MGQTICLAKPKTEALRADERAEAARLLAALIAAARARRIPQKVYAVQHRRVVLEPAEALPLARKSNGKARMAEPGGEHG